MAMLGFAGIALAELKNGVPAAEQLGGDIFGVLLLSITFTLASLFPKFSTGSSLKVRPPTCVHHYAALLGRAVQLMLWAIFTQELLARSLPI